MKIPEMQKAIQKVNMAINELNEIAGEGPDETMQGMIHISVADEIVRVTCYGGVDFMASLLYTAAIGDEVFAAALFMAANGLTDNQ